MTVNTSITSKILGLILLAWFFTVLYGATLAFSQQENIATVMALRGVATASSINGGERALEKNSGILVTDLIHTGAKARIQLRFLDQTVVNLGQNASLNISQFNWDQKKQKGSLKMDIEEGAFRVIGGLITKKSPQNFSMNSPVATIGIRGSSFAGKVAERNLDVVFLSGVGIFVTNSTGTVDLSIPGLGTEATRFGGLSVPSAWSLEKLKALSLEYLDSEKETQTKRVPTIQNQPSALLPQKASDGSGSTIAGSILNQSENQNSMNIATGGNNKANLGSISVNASESEATIVNQSHNIESTNIAIGKGNTSNLGSIRLHEANAEGSILNQSANNGSTNLSAGEENQSNQGSIIIE